jgi:hypothetical protein
MSTLLTFHRILASCEGGDPEAWKAFLADYTPMVFQLFAVYLPGTLEWRLEFWREALGVLSANNYEGLRGFSHQSEREFLVDLRAFLLDRVSTKIDSSQDLTSPPAPNLVTLSQLLKGLPLLHQEIVFLTLAGYAQAKLERIMRISPSVAQDGLERLRANYPAALDRSENRCLWPAGWIALTRSTRASKQEDCAPLRQFVRTLDGQASWYDKNPVEEHRSSCLRCLELWTSLLEVVAWERDMEPWPPEKTEPLLSAVPVKAGGGAKKSFLAWVLRK